MKNKSNFLRGISMFIGISLSIGSVLLAVAYAVIPEIK